MKKLQKVNEKEKRAAGRGDGQRHDTLLDESASLYAASGVVWDEEIKEGSKRRKNNNNRETNKLTQSKEIVRHPFSEHLKEKEGEILQKCEQQKKK